MSKTPVEQPKRAAIYTRISQDKKKDDDDSDYRHRGGDGLGVARQEEDCGELAQQLKWDVVEVFEDNDISAYSGKRRPRFEALLEAMDNGEFDALLCWHTDRLYRSMKDLERVIEIADAQRIVIKAVQGGELDLSTSAGRMVARILGSVARQESEHSGERRSRAYVQKAGLGAWETANRPFGYTAVGKPLEPEAQAIRDAVAAVLDGTSVQAIARRWNEAGLTTTRAGATYRRNGEPYTVEGKWRAPRVRRVLLNPRYAGLKVHRGKVFERDVDGKQERVKGTWDPLVDVGDHDRLVALLTDPARVTTTSWERRWQGAGIYRCGVCGGPMRSNKSGGRKRTQRRHYVCRNRKKGCVLRNAKNLDDHVANLILERLTKAKLVVPKKPDDGVAKLQDERAEWVAKLDKLVDLLDDLDTPVARSRAVEYKAEIAAIDRKLAAALRVSPAGRLMASGQDLRERWEQMDATLRSQVIDELVEVRVLPAKRGRGFDTDALDVRWK